MSPYRDQFPQCPRCDVAMVSLTLMTGHKVANCPECRGNWIGQAVFAEIAARLHAPRDPSLAPRNSPDPPLVCPDCARTLLPRSHANAVSLDECPQHGIWFDWAELQACLS